MVSVKYQQAKFLVSAAEISQLPPDEGVEVAFVGRSNVGKSSLLNKLTQQKKLARVSKKPGCTQYINFFIINEHQRLVDLPGYGYAQVSAETKQQWRMLIDHYLRHRKSLKGLVLLMDVRHPLQLFDDFILHLANEMNLFLHVVLTKADKVKRQEQMETLKKVKDALMYCTKHFTVQLFSTHDDIGREDLQRKLDKWFAI